jgi:hypothetical protein
LKTGTPAPQPITKITETFDVLEATFPERTDGKLTARIRIAQAGVSKNNRNYRASALEDAHNRQLFVGARMFLNHDRKKSPIERPFQDMMSAIESTEWDAASQTLYGTTVFFDKDFYEKAQRAKDYMGTSLSAMVKGTRSRDSAGRVYEDVQSFDHVRSDDWVIFPAAGGGIESFAATEGEEDEMDWGTVTLEQLQKEVPNLLEEFKKGIVHESEGDEAPKEPAKPQDVKLLVQEAVQDALKQDREAREKREGIVTQITGFLGKSGLPEKTRGRLVQQLSVMESYDEALVSAAVDEAKAELKAAGAGPRIVGNGTSGAPEGDSPAVQTMGVQESVERSFGVPQASDKKKDSSGEGK